MSRDKYAQNHTITLEEGSGTLTIDGNLDVNLNATITNNLTVGNDAVINGDLTLAGAFDVPYIDLSSPIPQVYRLLGVDFRPIDSATFARVTYGVTSNFGRLTENSGNYTDYLIATAPSLPHGALITGVSFTGYVTGVTNTITFRIYDTNSISSTLLDTLAATGMGARATITNNINPDYQINYNNNNRAIFITATILRANNAGPVYIDSYDISYTVKTFPQDYTINPV